MIGNAPESEAPVRPELSRGRSKLVRLAIVLAFGLLALQLWRLQIVEGPLHGRAAEQNRIRLEALPALRGVVYDRHGEILAGNAPTFVVSVIEADIPRPRRAAMLTKLAALLGTTREELETTLSKNRIPEDVFTPVQVRGHVSREAALTIEEHGWDLPGVQVSVTSARAYTDAEIISHVLGYLLQPSPEDYERKYRGEGYSGRDKVGASGVEAAYESELRGRAGTRLVEIDVSGRPLQELRVVAPEAGRNIQLTIDLALQRTVANILRSRLAPNSSGVALVADPQSGEMLAMVSIPGFDGNVFSQPDRDQGVAALLSDPGLPLFHRAIAGQYPPGSTFKLITGAAALQERTASRNTRIVCQGELRVPHDYNPRATTRLPDWAAHGVQDFIQGLANSCNVYFYTLGGGFGEVEGLGNERLARYAQLLGYGELTGIDLPGEEPGRVPNSTWKAINLGEQWLKGDTYNMSIGQGFILATPLQVAGVTHALANGGTLVQPHVGKAVLDAEGRTVRPIEAPAIRRLDLRPDVIAVMREGMEAVLNTDQLRNLRLADVRVAGKTGTAEYFEIGRAHV